MKMEREKFDLENFPTSTSAKKMLSYVSDGFYDKSYVGKWLYEVIGIEYDKAREIIEELSAQFFPETATWGLKYHEIKWGLPEREGIPYDERRKQIYRKRDDRPPMTPWRLEKALKNEIGFEVRISDIHDSGEYGYIPSHPNVFKVYLIGEGTLDKKKVFEILSRLKQSHTTYVVNYVTLILLDNSKLEKFLVSGMLFRVGIDFMRYDRFLDGNKLLDGTKILTASRCVGMDIFLTSTYSIHNKFYADSRAIVISADTLFVSGVKTGSITHLSMNSSIGNITAAKLKTSIAATSIEETLGYLTIETFSRDYGFLDGEKNLDGTKILKSIYKKEAIE